jgi:hypothetical protein
LKAKVPIWKKVSYADGSVCQERGEREGLRAATSTVVSPRLIPLGSGKEDESQVSGAEQLGREPHGQELSRLEAMKLLR